MAAWLRYVTIKKAYITGLAGPLWLATDFKLTHAKYRFVVSLDGVFCDATIMSFYAYCLAQALAAGFVSFDRRFCRFCQFEKLGGMLRREHSGRARTPPANALRKQSSRGVYLPFAMIEREGRHEHSIMPLSWLLPLLARAVGEMISCHLTRAGCCNIIITFASSTVPRGSRSLPQHFCR